MREKSRIHIFLITLLLAFLLPVPLIAAPAENGEAMTSGVRVMSVEEWEAALAVSGNEMKVVGKDGILYEDVEYLSAYALGHLKEDARSVYAEMCENIAYWKTNGYDVSGTVISLDKSGELRMSATFSEDVIPELAEAEISETALTEEVIMVGEGEESAEEIDEENTLQKVSDDFTLLNEEYEENTALEKRYEIPEEQIDNGKTPEGAVPDVIMEDENYFRKQLRSNTEKRIYDAAKAKLVKGNSNRFSIDFTQWMSEWTHFNNAYSALYNTYPNKFNWINEGGSFVRAVFHYSGGKCRHTYTFVKSKYYTSDLEKRAAAKAEKLVDEAFAYADKYFSDNPTYGIVRYLNDWICDNGYYNYDALADTESVHKSDVYYYCHNAYGILLKGYGVCESYALAMDYLLDAAGIRNMYVEGGTYGGLHAWNNVQMPDGKWYMLDTTWNDTGDHSNDNYFLTKEDSGHSPWGNRWLYSQEGYQKFEFEPLSNTDYSLMKESEIFELNGFEQDKLFLKPKEKCSLALNVGAYYDRYRKQWNSSNTNVARVEPDGKITAVAPGRAVVTVNFIGKVFECEVYVYQFTSLKHQDTGKSSRSIVYINEDAVFDYNDTQTIYLDLNQKNPQIDSEQIFAQGKEKAPAAVCSNSKVLKVDSCLPERNTIRLQITPNQTGSAKITVKAAGKTATLTVKVRQKLQEEWFSELPYTSVPYSGKAYRPKVTKTDAAPGFIRYSVKYKNQKAAGKATVCIKGSGRCCGEIVRTFTIERRDIADAELIACTSYKQYTGRENKVSVKLKIGKNVLKAGRDYEISYDGSLEVPKNTGTYVIHIEGTGNYKGMLPGSREFEIRAATLDKLRVKCSSGVKYTGAEVYPKIAVKLGKTLLTEEDYEILYYDSEGNTVRAPQEKGRYKAAVFPRGSNITGYAEKRYIMKSFLVK